MIVAYIYHSSFIEIAKIKQSTSSQHQPMEVDDNDDNNNISTNEVSLPSLSPSGGNMMSFSSSLNLNMTEGEYGSTTTITSTKSIEDQMLINNPILNVAADKSHTNDNGFISRETNNNNNKNNSQDRSDNSNEVMSLEG
jgi:hypothetical protein